MDTLREQKSKKATGLRQNIWITFTMLLILADVSSTFQLEKETTCTKGLLLNEDRFRIEATIVATAQDISSNGIVFFRRSANRDSGYSLECTLDIINECSSNIPPDPFGCYCKINSTVTDTYTVSLRRASTQTFNNEFIRVVWNTTTTIQIPKIYDPTSKDGAAPTNFVNLSSPCTVLVGEDRLVKYRCQNTAEPCNATIEYRGSVTHDDTCAELILPRNALENETVTFSYSICGGPQTVTHDQCQLRFCVPCPHDCVHDFCWGDIPLIVVCGLVLLVIICLMVYTVWKKKHSKDIELKDTELKIQPKSATQDSSVSSVRGSVDEAPVRSLKCPSDKCASSQYYDGNRTYPSNGSDDKRKEKRRKKKQPSDNSFFHTADGKEQIIQEPYPENTAEAELQVIQSGEVKEPRANKKRRQLPPLRTPRTSQKEADLSTSWTGPTYNQTTSRPLPKLMKK